MRTILLRITTVCGLLLCAIVPAHSEAARIVLLGDSISAGYGIAPEQGWAHLLAEELAPAGHEVINASLSGETTGGGLARIDDLMVRHKPDIVIVELGGNDGLRGYPIKRIKANLDALVARVQESDAIPLILGMEIPPNYGPRYVSAFRSVFASVAEARAAQLVPFLLAEVALERRLMQRDGIHPTAEAQPLLLAAVLPTLQPLLERHASE